MELTISEYVAYYNCHMEHVVLNTLVYKKMSLKTPSKKTPSSTHSVLGYASKSNKD